jgi:hypothetical protein
VAGSFPNTSARETEIWDQREVRDDPGGTERETYAVGNTSPAMTTRRGIWCPNASAWLSKSRTTSRRDSPDTHAGGRW